jgi:hypothetical protein
MLCGIVGRETSITEYKCENLVMASFTDRAGSQVMPLPAHKVHPAHQLKVEDIDENETSRRMHDDGTSESHNRLAHHTSNIPADDRPYPCREK